MLLFAIITTNQHQPRGYIRSYTRNTIMLLFTVLSIQTFFFELGHENQAEAKVVVAEVGRVVDANRRATAPCNVAPAIATNHSVRTTARTSRISLQTTAIIAIPIRTPLTHIAAHVVEPKFIGLLCSHGVSIVSTVAMIPCYIT